MELLSPAGNRDALIAAIACGADAVYLGYTAFGARSYAGNFDEHELAEAIEYAHERGKKIFVTVNTLVKQCELDDLGDVLELLSRYGADAVIVQDLGVARIARTHFPNLTLHASTQMTIHNAQGAELMKSLGFNRVVPARECSLEELRRMADTGVEIEAFAHGALCVAVSGQCLFSSMIGGRSGNRGRCAQPCRLPYRSQNGENGYLLSTRDLMLIDRLPEMRDAGVYSFKLEGRMKRPEYVGVVTRAYREALDAVQAHVPYHPSHATIEGLKQIFNRGGFTEGYVMDRSNAALMSWERPNHWGISLGNITSLRGPIAKVMLSKELHDGDGLQVRGRHEIDLTYSGPDTTKGREATVRIATQGAQVGDPVYRLTDERQMKEIRELMSRESVAIPLHAHLFAIPGQLPVLTLNDDDGHTISVTGNSPVDQAQQRPLDRESALKQLGKTGGTPYVLESLTIESEQAFMTAGAMNALRRQGLEEIRKARTAIENRKTVPVIEPGVWPKKERLLIVQGEKLEAAHELLACGADAFVWHPQVYLPNQLEAELLANPDVSPTLLMPAVVSTDELHHLYAFVKRHATRLSGLVLNNPGQFALSWPVPVSGGQGLNVMNAQCAQFFYGLGAKCLTASCELSYKELKQLFDQGGNYEIEVYGRTLLMLLSHCPQRTSRGDERQDAHCNACAQYDGVPDVYADRKGYRFPARRMKMEHGCVVRLYNSVVTDMAKSAQKLHDLGCSLRISFLDEPIHWQKEIVASYRHVLDGGKALHQPQENTTSGQLLRGVE